MPADSQKLIAYGKVMDDLEKTLKDYKIAEGGFIVVMVQKVSKMNLRSPFKLKISKNYKIITFFCPLLKFLTSVN